MVKVVDRNGCGRARVRVRVDSSRACETSIRLAREHGTDRHGVSFRVSGIRRGSKRDRSSRGGAHTDEGRRRTRWSVGQRVLNRPADRASVVSRCKWECLSDSRDHVLRASKSGDWHCDLRRENTVPVVGPCVGRIALATTTCFKHL